MGITYIMKKDDLIIESKQSLQQNIEIIQSNEITMSRHNFTVMEKRAIYLIIVKLRQELDGKITNQRDLLGDVYMRFKAEDLIRASERPEHVYSAFRRLRDKTFEINNDEVWEYFGIVERPTHKKKEGFFEIRVPKPIINFFVNQMKKFTAYSATVALTLKKSGSQRLYEMCSQFKKAGGFYVNYEDFKIRLMIDQKTRFNRWANVKNDLINPARKELKDLFDNGLSDLFFEYTADKSGRRVLGLKFKVKTREERPLEKFKLDDFVHYSKTWLNSWFEVNKKPKNKEYVNKILKIVILSEPKAKDLFLTLERIQKAYPAEDWAKVARFAINNDFEIEME